ncbi:MAG: peptidoglycan bridge formation glycyltransferase FemA/FemB family protein [Pseudomonadales bacterium]|nr:peptidoglycan bridge formation glycyltransferase FemA/FemB family protein [Pseudomonadales bacterium]
MNITFLYITDKNVWESNILLFKNANFLQSWNWSLFQERMGKIVVRLLIQKNNVTLGMALLVCEKAKRGTYISIAGGPLIDWTNQELINLVFEKIKLIAKEKGAIFIRFRPQAIDSIELRNTVAKIGAKTSQMHLTADLTLQLNLENSEDEILKQMRKNTRYSINKSDREGISINFSKDKNDIKEFYDLQIKLAKKHGFVPFTYDFLYNQFISFLEDDQVLMIHSKLNNRLLATAFIIFYNKEAVYHYGISTPENGKYAGSYACQWAAIKEAKRRGCIKYNFWGIAPENELNHRFTGVSLFKRGFGGEEVKYLPSHDISLSPLYHLTYYFEMLRRKFRKL